MPDSDNTHRSDSDTALAAMRQRDAELMTRYGWGAHALTDAPLIHTHGRPEGFHHPDLEMRLAISPQKRHELLTILAEALKAGKRFYPGDEDTTLFSVSVRFIAREESGRIVTRGLFRSARPISRCSRLPRRMGHTTHPRYVMTDASPEK